MAIRPALQTCGAKTSSYRPDIDGLRAFAVVMVVLFHAFPGAWKGGFVGVDVFFVISGYLIGGVILEDLDNNRFTFRNFYSRRIRRIFPALVTVLAATLLVGWILFLPNEYAALGKHTFGGASFIANFFLWQESGYFDLAAKVKPLLHLWSLSIEEQFYLVFPFVLWLCAKNRGQMLLILVFLCGISFGSNIWLSQSSPAAEFYSPASRVWELLIGSALCAVMRQPELLPVTLRQRTKALVTADGRMIRCLLAFAGMSLLLLALLAAKRPAHWPGWVALLPTAGTAMLLVAGPEAWINRTLLSHRFAVGIGLISYPLYLWHWPLLSSAFIANGEMTPSFLTRSLLIALAFVLSAVTYWLVEKPLRFGQYARQGKVFCLILGMALVGSGGCFIWLHNGLASRIPNLAQIDSALNAMSDQHFLGDDARKEFQGADYWEQASHRKQTTLFIGDSLANQYWPRIDELIATWPDEVNSAIFMTCLGCLPLPGMRYEPPLDKGGKCNDYAGKALEMAKNSPEITTVVISGSWRRYLRKGDTEGTQGKLHALSRYVQEFIAAGKKVFLVSYMPQDRSLHPKAVIDRAILRYPNVFSVHGKTVSRAALEETFGAIPNDLEKIARDAGANVIRPMDFLCKEECNALDAQGNPMYFDGWHLSGAFARHQAAFIDAAMR